jgi:hypothetical protein
MSAIGTELAQSNSYIVIGDLVDKAISFHERRNDCEFVVDARRVVTEDVYRYLLVRIELAEKKCAFHSD